LEWEEVVVKIEDTNLLSVIDIEKWQKLQDALAVATDMAIITIDCTGVPVTEHSHCSEFCKRMRKAPELGEECQKCDSLGAIEAARLQKPYIYRCHANILDAAVPLIVNNHYLGAIMIGQVLLSESSEEVELEVVCAPNRQKLEQQIGSNISLMNQLPRLSWNRVQMIVNMLFHLYNYIVEEATEKNLALDIYTNVLGVTRFEGDFSRHGVEKLQSIKRKLDNGIVDAHITLKETEDVKTVSDALKPAIQYISTHKGERCSLAQMAELCHLSQSYFSRLFLREMGEAYSSYLLRTRIKWAKELLATTNKHINEIAVLVGFSDSGHFIRNFRKYEGTTPARFRKFYCK
jgi:ligand-binding sensor protein/AraC-like DNA-binding protein